jgi:hypothetical protein
VSGVEGALEGAIVAALAVDADVKALLGDPPRVFEAARARPAFPYLEIARHEVTAADSAAVDANEHRIDLAIVTREGGRTPAREALRAVRAALAEPPEMDQWRCVLLLPVFADMVRTRFDGWRAILRLKAVTELSG